MNHLEIEKVAKERVSAKGRLSVLLISPGMNKSEVIASDWPVMPIGPAYVSAALKKAEIRTYTLNLIKAKGTPEEAVVDALERWDIDLAGIGTLVTDWKQAEKVLRTVKRYDEHIITYLGGGGITCSPNEHMELVPDADIGMIGEGEVSAVELVETLESGGSLTEVDGLVLRNADGTLRFNRPRAMISDLDDLPWPDWDGFEFFEKAPSDGGSQDRIVCAPIVPSRGCPFHCTFCSKPSGSISRKRSLDTVFKEIDHLVSYYGVNRLFMDDDLFADPIPAKKGQFSSRLEEFCVRIRPYHIQWLLYLRVGPYMTDPLLQLMADSGCMQVYYGIESGDDTVLRSMKKGITVQMIEDTVRRTNEHGIRTIGSFIFGDPAETEETVKNTLSFSERMNESFGLVNYNPIILFPGAELYRLAVKQGKIEDTTEFIRNGLPLVNLTKMDDAAYRRLVRDILPAHTVKRMVNEENALGEPELKVDRETKELYIPHVCRNCGGHSRVAVTEKGLLDYLYHICPHCGDRVSFLAMGNYVKMVDERMKDLLYERHAAIWGAGMTYRYYKAFSKELGRQDYLLLDGDRDLQAWGVDGHEVVSPSELETHPEIQEIVVMALDSYDSIVEEIREKHPQIKRIHNYRTLAAEEGGGSCEHEDRISGKA